MSRFVLEINAGNDAFGDAPEQEVVRLLEAAAVQVSQGHRFGNLLDVNGNRVGTWAHEESPQRTFRVGNVYEFQAEDANHALEQYLNAMEDLGGDEANYIREITEED